MLTKEQVLYLGAVFWITFTGYHTKSCTRPIVSCTWNPQLYCALGL